ncbi:MAG: hypothetical protein PVI30_15365 [Myxococcales bacterium]|jgi:hypothetical protein
MSPRFLAAVAALTALLALLTVRGVFTLDEPNYAATVHALRHGRLTLPDTDGLGASQELLYFDPIFDRAPEQPVRLRAPPLYAFLALPFSVGGFFGLVWPNLLGFALVAVLVFAMIRRWTADAAVAWLGAGCVTVFAFNLEYAMGVWPHLLAVALVTGAFALAASACESSARWRAAALSGLLVGLAAGVRYQEVVYAGALGLGLLLWSSRRQVLAFGAGLSLPLIASATLNWQRLGIFHPFTKGKGYLKPTTLTAGGSGVGETTLPPALLRSLEPLRVLWTKVVDFSTHPPLKLGPVDLSPSPHSPAIVFVGAVKKALLQSLPWAALSLLVLALVFRRPRAQPGVLPLRMAALVCGAVLLAFAVAGYRRVDGICFNERYFLELVPLCALSLAWGVRGQLRRTPLLVGGLLGSTLCALVLRAADRGLHERALLWLPLVLSAALVASYLWPRGRVEMRARLISASLAAALAWSLVVHVGDDVRASRIVRGRMAHVTTVLDQALPRHGRLALFTLGYWSNAAAPLELSREVVILDALRDQVRDAPRLVGEALSSGRRVFVLENGFSPGELKRMAAGRPVRRVQHQGLALLEITPP